MGSLVYRSALPIFNQMFMSPVCWPTLSFARPGLPRYSGPHKNWKNVQLRPAVSQTFDISGLDETHAELALSEIRVQVKAAGFERGRYAGDPDVYQDGMGLNMRFTYLDQYSKIHVQLFASSSAEGVLGAVRRGWRETPERSLRALISNPMSEPQVSVGQLDYRANLLGVRYNRYVGKPSRAWSFYRFEEDQQTRVLEELLNQAEDAGYEIRDVLRHETLPLAQFRGKRIADRRRQSDMLTITASQQNVGIELRSC